MPRVDIPVTQIIKSGVAPPNAVTADPTNDHKFEGNDGRIFLDVFNLHASTPFVVTINTPGNVAGLAIADQTATVQPQGTQLVGPFPPTIFNQPGSDVVWVDVDNANLRLRAYRV